MKHSTLAVWLVGAVALALCGVAGLLVGPAGLEAVASEAILELRALRSLGAALTGAALGLGGLWLQATTRNPLADPYLLGTSAGATLAVVAALTLAAGVGLGAALAPATPLLALGGALAASTLAMRVGLRAGGSPDRVVLAGLVLTAFAGAATSLLLYRADDASLRAATQWLMGGVVVQSRAELVLPALAVGLGTWAAQRAAAGLDVMLLGRDAARGVGVDAAGLERRGAIWAAVLTAFAVAIAGIVGFVGLLVPHGARALVGGAHARLVPATALGGAAFLLAVDILCRVALAPAELPIGIPTALAGVPVLIGLFGGLRRGVGLARLQAPATARAAADSSQRDTHPTGGAKPARLDVDGLQVGFGQRPVLRAVRFSLPAGCLVALVGPNGAGKSTLLRALAGAQTSQGRVLDDGEPRAPGGVVQAERVVWLPQRVELPPGQTVRGLVGLPLAVAGEADAQSEAALRRALERAGATAYTDRPLHTLSGGQLQRALLAMTLVRPAPLLLLDEPTAALDPVAAAEAFATLAEVARTEDRTIVAASHDLHAALAHADRLLVLDANGQLHCIDAADTDRCGAALRAAFGDGIDALRLGPRLV
ncbi:MAG: hypothetical protein RIT45_1544 [Pseudomonadota bacterium]|jgi:iron complex transport system permease protein